MKISQSSLDYIRNAVSTADSVKIDALIIEPGRVRGIDENHTVFILQDTDVPDLEVGSIGLNRLGIFTSRFDLGKTLSDFTVDAIVEGDEPETMYARSLTMKAKGVKVEYRCANPTILKAPRILHDQLRYKVRLNPEVVVMLQKGMAAMSTDVVTLIGDESGLYFELSDINADKMRYQIADTITEYEIEDSETNEDDEDTTVNFSYTYSLKTILPLFKANQTTDIFFTAREGFLKIVVNGLAVYVLPGV